MNRRHNTLDKFKDIRPYLDSEIRPVLDRLIADPEFLGCIARFSHPRWMKLAPGPLLKLMAHRLRRQLQGVHDVKTMQDVIAGYLDKMIRDTTTALTNSGLDNLQPHRGHLFISNHRDITMDPAFVNYTLYHAGHDTLQIAIGDNLLKKPFVTDLMRLNKSFIVKRSLRGRELLRALRQLSEYIHYCIESGQNVWIAQREGRAKDGVDRTDPALLKMLAMASRDLPLNTSLARLHIVPVSISYQYDACDVMKAQELYQVENTGHYIKTDTTDMHSIGQGMVGFKGRVHVAFGHRLQAESDDAAEVAEMIDRQVIANYRLWDTNYLALERLGQDGMVSPHQVDRMLDSRSISSYARQCFARRLREVDSHLHRHWLFGYANPVLSRARLTPAGA